MGERDRYRPFTGDSDYRVRLDVAPLEMVLCQVRWPQVSALQGDLKHIAAEFGRFIPDFPLYSPSVETAIELTPSGPIQVPGNSVHQWSRVDRSGTVTLTSTFVAFYVKNYVNYDLFDEQLRVVLEAVEKTLRLPLFDRVGVRYVNRISAPEQVEKIEQLMRPEVLGHQALGPFAEGVSLRQSISQSLFEVGDGYLQARTGIVPPNETVDPLIEPLRTPSWILDIDSFKQEEAVFTADAVRARAGKLADAAYDFFKLVIKDSFVDAFEGRQL